MASVFSAASHFYYTSRNGLYLIITELSDINQSITETGTIYWYGKILQNRKTCNTIEVKFAYPCYKSNTFDLAVSDLGLRDGPGQTVPVALKEGKFVINLIKKLAKIQFFYVACIFCKYDSKIQ
jgi:hypothetical protein